MISIGKIHGVSFRVDQAKKSLIVDAALGELQESEIRVLKNVLDQSLAAIAEQPRRETLELNGQLRFD